MLEEIFLAYNAVQYVALGLVEIFEDGLSEVLDLPDHIPVLVVRNVGRDEVHNPYQNAVGTLQRLDKLVDGHFLNLAIVEFHAKIGGKIKLTGKVAEDGLKERVDGLYVKLAVVVNQTGQGNPSLPRGKLFTHM